MLLPLRAALLRNGRRAASRTPALTDFSRSLGPMDVPHSAEDDSSSDPHSFQPLDVSGYRKPYYNAKEPYFLEHNAADDPFLQFHQWFADVCAQERISYEEMNAVCLSTCVDNRPSSRMVLLKKYDARGFCFFSNALSRKGRELARNPNAAMLFYWPFVNRQVRIEGRCEQLTDAEVDEYWQSRPANSRIGGMISKQSHVIPSRAHLEEKRSALQAQLAEHGERVLERPSSWTGFRLKPDYFEFWQGQSDRIHDRLVFRPDPGHPAGWKRERLAP